MQSHSLESKAGRLSDAPVQRSRPAFSAGSRILAWAAGIGLVAALYAVFMYSPDERVMGPVQKIFYFHVASAWNGFLAFFVVFVASIAYLRTRKPFWDVMAYASAEIGVVFTTIVMITGPMWAKVAWSVWWNWEPRLTTTLILWFVYGAYLLMRSAAEGGSEREAVLGAVFGIVGFADVPLVYMSARWWRVAHPIVIEGGKMNMEPSMAMTLMISVFAFTLLYFHLLGLRRRLEESRHQARMLRDELRDV